MRNKWEILTFLAFLTLSWAKDTCKPSVLPPEKRIVRATIAIKALVTEVHSNSTTEVWILDVYKGEDKLAAALGLPGTGAEAIFHLKDQRINVSHFGDSSRCWNELVTQRTYVILLQPSYYQGQRALFKGRYDDPFGAAIDYTQETEKRLLKALGWSPWSEWSPCSQSCDGGQQKRHRECLLTRPSSSSLTRSFFHSATFCGSSNAEKRTCNSFSCSGAVNTLSIKEERYFKPSPSAFTKVVGRGPDAWQIRPGSYFLLPFMEAFGQKIPRDFTIFLTIKPAEESEGILLSLNARNSRQEYISLELNEGRLELVHSLPNGSKIIDIPVRINDGHWHQLAISVHGGSSVRTYLDCHWITTQVLHRHALNVPKDTDLIVGYMYQGEIEQLTFVDETSGGVSEQCSPNRVPFQVDEKLAGGGVSDFHIQEDEKEEDKAPQKTNAHKKAGGSASAKPEDYLDEEYVDLDWSAEVTTTEKPSSLVSTLLKRQKRPDDIDEEDEDGSGSFDSMADDEEDDIPQITPTELFGSGDFDLDWSAWSPCSKSCGKRGLKTRLATCVDNGGLFEECMMASSSLKKQTMPCNRHPCPQADSGWIPVAKNKLRYETVTRVDVENARHSRPPTSKNASYDLFMEVATTSPTKDSPLPEEHANVIPRIPNYWAPDSRSNDEEPPSSSKSPQCWCANGGSCEYHNHIYGHHHPLREVASCKCRKGYSGKHCEQALCRPGCANGGLCVDPDVCSCPDGFTGARCQTAFCHPGCQNGGSCVAPFKCECPLGVTGAFCQDYSCEPGCANGGVCIGHNLCSCPHGFSGPDCQDKTCTVRCENGGVCTMPDNKCKCRDGFYGARCHKKLCRRYETVREPHTRAYKQVVEKEYDTICENGLPCKKTRPEYKTIIKTVYRTAYKCASDLE